MMLSLLAFLTATNTCFKMLGVFITEMEMRVLCESIADNWLTIQDENERKILCEYSRRGRALTIYIAIFYSTAGISMSLPPLIPKTLDRIYPLDEPRPDVYLLQGEFFIDRDEHFFKLLFCDAIMCIAMCTLVIGIESMYIVSSQHCCALYAILRYRLQNVRSISCDNPLTVVDGDSHNWMIRTIELHQKALNFTSTVNATFSLTFLFIMTLFIAMIPLTACSILANLRSLLGVYPYIVIFVAFAINLFILCWPGQMILDHGRNLYVTTYCNEWYAMPLHTKKLLLTCMQRCSKPVSLNVGEILEINYELYSKILKTAISYITVLASFR
ncbi:odorant receptor 22c-like [Phymastichus coffea]|uniref:odorant receptor 22c-like n=1 Tax=Phymastichus coffea TaxID=108790 RepID=UPI00273B8C8D|nr:odorant receptor 22c-like [Phymastichus coffea]